MSVKNKKVGKQTIKLENPPKIISTYSIVGPKEGDGPLKDYFHEILNDDTLGKDSFEKAESEMMYTAIKSAISNASLREESIDYLFAGDLLNQITSSSFAARELNIPFIGLYGACSTMSESLSMASLFLDGGFGDYIVASTSSHFSSAERQFRFPLEYGNQRPFSATWTVTGCGAAIVTKRKGFARITGVTTGKIIDYGVKDAQNMGACMAPAAADVIYNHLNDFGTAPDDYDKIITGDLGYVGQAILIDLLKRKGIDISKVHMDCGIEMFDKENQDTHSGGSGCGCSATVLTSYVFKQLKKKAWKKILFIPTGALMSPISFNQGKSVPGIAHLVVIESV